VRVEVVPPGVRRGFHTAVEERPRLGQLLRRRAPGDHRHREGRPVESRGRSSGQVGDVDRVGIDDDVDGPRGVVERDPDQPAAERVEIA
jgi:hypothetical protein